MKKIIDFFIYLLFTIIVLIIVCSVGGGLIYLVIMNNIDVRTGPMQRLTETIYFTLPVFVLIGIAIQSFLTKILGATRSKIFIGFYFVAMALIVISFYYFKIWKGSTVNEFYWMGVQACYLMGSILFAVPKTKKLLVREKSVSSDPEIL
ncbi:hypothetical protein OO013_07310 [Mangrovivirga sp. M17]|uniref:DUF4293 family protein n=1 Tax=Mangrovivirga halotolerans TaxID=2993936 RepID=A0ABT3RPE8_9BACT|nr:hypothetical protein [Mangrovivirga halotolerans]MCX2743666.1 hypothetical protein [Mangrovivirga halotolerans]